jgi:glycerophosphoryl diester phosphodiesterase
VVRSPAGTARRRLRARDAPGSPGNHLPSVQLIGHAGLAIQNDGGSPTRDDLDGALDIGVDRLELDVCSTADGRLVMRHDVCILDGACVADLDLAELRMVDPHVLTIDEAVEHLDDRVPILLDIKMARAAELLGAWLRFRRDLDSFALCTEKVPWLLHLRFAAPDVARWPSFPDLGERRTHHVQRVVTGLWRSHASLPGLRRGVVEVHRAARELRHRPQVSLGRLAGLPWRGRLPADLTQIRDDVAAAGLCVHHWVISDHLVDEAHQLGLHVNTWTINNPFTARVVAAAGVDSITTDRVEGVRRALGAPPPDARAADAALRAAVRIAPS